MSKKRNKRQKKVNDIDALEQINLNAAGVDIGAEDIYVAVPKGLNEESVRSYGEIAAITGKPRAAQAVGRTEETNPIPIVIPCHRVVASIGNLHGYSARGGLETKAWLLQLEGYLKQ